MRNKEETKRKIITAAMDAFNEYGYEGATTSFMAKKAGVNELTIFRHFKTKKNLIMEMIRYYSPLEKIRSMFGEDLSGNLREDLIKMGVTFISMITGQGKSVIMGLSAAMRIDELRRIYLKMAEEQTRMFKDYFSGQIENGSLKNIDPEIAAQMFNEMLFGISLRVVLSGGKRSGSSIENTVCKIVDMIIGGIGKNK